MSSKDAENRQYSFAGFVLDGDRGSLLKNGEEIRLRPKSFSLLEFMLQHPGSLLTKDDMLNAVWPDTVVTDDAITQCLIDIRRALDDGSHDIISTIPRRGYRFDADVTTAEATGAAAADPADEPDRRWTWPILAATALAVFAALAWFTNENSNNSAGREGSHYSVAVLPFLDMTAGQDFGYFADGLSEELINVLAKADGLRVISRTSSFAFRRPDIDVAEIREKLDVTHVLEGSVRLSGDTLRITAQLIDTNNQDHVWSETYNRQLADSLEIQDDIAKEVLDRLSGSLSIPLQSLQPENPVVHRMYLHGKYLLDTTDPQHHDKAESLLQKAVELEPQFAAAWRELARAQWRRIGSGPDIEGDIAAANALLQRALSADPNDAGTLAYLGWHNADFPGDLETAARLFERAVAVDAAHEDVVRTASVFAMSVGYESDALALVEFGVDRNPLCSPCLYASTQHYLDAGKVEKAVAAIREFQRLYDGGHYSLGVALLMLQKPAEALASFEKEQNEKYRLAGMAAALYELGRAQESEEVLARLLSRNDARKEWLIAQVYAWRQQADAAFAAIDHAIHESRVHVNDRVIRENLIGIGGQLNSPLFAALRQDQRWNELLEKLGLAPAQLAALDLSYKIPD